MRLTLGQAAEVRLGRQRSPKDHEGDSMVPYLRSANVVDGALDLSDVKHMNFEAEEQTLFRLASGDVLMTEGSGSRETVGTSAVWADEISGPVCFQNTLLRLRPRTGITDGRFLAWWARHAHASGQIGAAATGANILHLGSDGLKRLTLFVPSPEEQQRIAGFLDGRVARIDGLIAARREQIRFARDAMMADWTERTRAVESLFPNVPLRRFLVSIVDGPFGSSLTSSHYSDTGTRVIRLGNIGVATFRDHDRAYISATHASALLAHSVAPGDLIMAGMGDDRWPLGRCAIAPADIGPAIVKADCYRIRLDPRISHEFAAAFLSSPPAAARAGLLGRGATRARLNTDVAKASEISTAGESEQRDYVMSVGALHARFASAEATLAASVRLLTEYKTSLITAAVTGELDVTTAGSGIPA
ncbi:restriction endonuclease subunit S [Nocardioides sp. Soil774]|uniref:restriction endonuclease subunit S n=1 Tax=Nocardioides sp. Soil774 TaxID=1736408 RepID=UPI000A6F8374|nr:restriction endonuclease subunit S [Nocardioides sp. Soil774]